MCWCGGLALRLAAAVSYATVYLLEDSRISGAALNFFRSVWYEVGLSVGTGSDTSLAPGFPQLALRPLDQFCLKIS